MTVPQPVVARLIGPLILLLAVAPLGQGQQASSLDQLIRQFESETVFWRQIEVAKAIVAAHDPSVLPKLESWLTHEDRHLRGNAAFIFAGLGDPRGFDVIEAILRDYSERPVEKPARRILFRILLGTRPSESRSAKTVTTPRTSWVT